MNEEIRRPGSRALRGGEARQRGKARRELARLGQWPWLANEWDFVRYPGLWLQLVDTGVWRWSRRIMDFLKGEEDVRAA